MRFVFACGGTGGHVYPALALAQELKTQGHDCHFVGRIQGMERDLIGDKFPYHGIPAYPLKRGKMSENLLLPFRLIKSYFAAHKLIMKLTPNAVIGTGGYVSLPTLLAAGGLKTPVFLQEQNLHAGVANKIASRFAQAVYVAGNDVVSAFPAEKCEVLGNPIREIPSDTKIPEPFEAHSFNILILGGSQGARGVNQRVAQAITELKDRDNLRIMWQCGKGGVDEFQHFQHTGKIGVQAFLDPIYPYMAHADLIISRAGASTLSEILAFGKAAIYIPFPHAAEDHQTKNAQSMQKNGAAMIEQESETFGLTSKIESLLDHPDKLEAMSAAAKNEFKPNSTTNIVNSILTHLEKK